MRVSDWSTARVKHCAYSVPSRLIGEWVRVRIFEDRIEVRFADELQLACERLLGRNQRRIDYHQDKLRSDAVAKIVIGVLVAVAAIALTVVSLGAATPAVLAAGASVGAAGLSTYMAYEEYKHYAEEHTIAHAGFADDPSVTWLVLAIVGAGVDMASAATVIRKLAPAARMLGEATTVVDADRKLVDFAKAVEKLRAQKQIEETIAAAANKAAAARTSYAAAKAQFTADLKIAASGARGAMGPFTDPTVFRGLVKMAVAKIREGMHSLEEFIGHLKKARIDAQLDEMSPEELVKAKDAWAQAEALSMQVKDPVLVDKLLERGIDPATIEQLTSKLSNPEEVERFLNNTKLVDAAEQLKLLKHAKVANGAQLLELLDNTDSAARLLRMLDIATMPSGAKLLEFVEKAGGIANSGLLEDLLSLARSGNVLDAQQLRLT